MNSPQQAAAAVQLPDGRVLLVGGDVAIFDPVTETCSPTGRLNTPRALHTATLLGNGKVLVAGGSVDGGHGLTSTELYDPVSGVWTASAPLRNARCWHTATLLADGRVLIAGGTHIIGTTTYVLASVEIYNPSSGNWTTARALNVAHYRHTATLMPDGQVLIAGGYNTTLGFLSTSELYNSAQNAWTITGALNEARDDHTAALLKDGKVLITGGVGVRNHYCFQLLSAELYDPATGSWSFTSALNSGRAVHASTLLSDGRVLITGGRHYTEGTIFKTAEMYVPDDTGVILTGARLWTNNVYQFTFSASPGSVGEVFAGASLSLSTDRWTMLGIATEIAPGQFEFFDFTATNSPTRFYRVGPPPP